MGGGVTYVTNNVLNALFMQCLHYMLHAVLTTITGVPSEKVKQKFLIPPLTVFVGGNGVLLKRMTFHRNMLL
jgi:hypothetical protein